MELIKQLTTEFNESVMNKIQKRLATSREFILSKWSDEFRTKELMVLQFMAAIKILNDLSQGYHDFLVEEELKSKKRANISDEDVKQLAKDLNNLFKDKNL